MERAPSNLSPTEYAAAVERNPTYGQLVPAGTSGSSSNQSAASVASTSSVPAGTTEAQARDQLSQIASEPGNSALKMQLAQEGISLTDNSDVGPGKRFDSFVDKLGYVMDKKAALLIAVVMSMVSSGGWGPSNSEEVSDARKALRSA